MSVVVFVGFLVTLWVLLWGTVSIANVVSGLAVAGLVLLVLPDSLLPGRKPVFRPLAAIRLFAQIVYELVRSNLVVASDALRIRSTVCTGVIGVPMPHASDSVLTFVASVLALSPGILPIEVEDDPGIIFVHILHAHDVEKVRLEIQHLAWLTIKAFGSKEAVAALKRSGASTVSAEEAGREIR